ncbi:adenosylcobinamide-phosphate synthase CbiB [uncultured Megasphaera sp.]|uniref:adenosylcobinamide-phosphate synthase CbiB n=1 Tax=uncultured Megasphaera sp. TaxID=165188 RepID=UPI0026582C9B|nr:adenosylcobinamide-phosphate synthase CbiB [uncultured Megasphaera sp.]
MISLLAFLLDVLWGDPRTRLHPVALMGKLISLLERWLYASKAGKTVQFLSGAVLSLLVLWIVYDVTVLFLTGLSYLHMPYVSYGLQAVVLSFMICPKSLAQAGQEIYHLLLHHHLAAAREKVGWIVGRDTQKLDESEIVRATVETVAENTTDGIVSPLFFFALAGLPGAVVYRAANTLDSMIGYKNDRYLYFGRFAARLDDVLNYIPARIGALFFLLAAAILQDDVRQAWRILRRDAAKHPSPNGGYSEAAVAGALRIRLGGYNSYFGRTSFRAYMGDPQQELVPRHIRQAISLMYVVTILAVLAAALCRWQ